MKYSNYLVVGALDLQVQVEGCMLQQEVQVDKNSQVDFAQVQQVDKQSHLHHYFHYFQSCHQDCC